ncbi:MAG: hypothetical protein O3C40_21255 [Planctomycetota bacterium]|nr:hypothetical protein [Planctomycetota bacterium]
MKMPPELLMRIVWEAAAVKQQFPGCMTLVDDGAGSPRWCGAIPVEGTAYPVTCSYPLAYPAVPPTLATAIDLPAGCPHVLGPSEAGHVMCWITPRATGERRRWDPLRHTAATALGAAQRWFLALLVFRVKGVWPVDDAFQPGVWR